MILNGGYKEKRGVKASALAPLRFNTYNIPGSMPAQDPILRGILSGKHVGVKYCPIKRMTGMRLLHAPLPPGLDKAVVVNRLTFRFLIDLGLGRAGLVQPVGLVFLGIQLRSAFALRT